MISMPKRSVTRFFIPLIDVLTLLFCIYLLMPIVKPSNADADDSSGARRDARLEAAERKELRQLRVEQGTWLEHENLRQEIKAQNELLMKLQLEKLASLKERLAIRVLEIGDDGKLYYYDGSRARDRRVEITADNASDLIRRQQESALGRESFFLILYPRVATGSPAFPLRSQREEYDRWFQDVAHGYDIPIVAR